MKASNKAEREDTDLRANTYGSGWVVTSIIALSVIGWADVRNTERQAIVGAGAGAAVGGVIGRTVGSITSGAIVGAIVGAAAGAIIRHSIPVTVGRDGAEAPWPNP
ncbi:MAG: YMGG-like glycine zipper-containing protein [Rhodothermales bacterium]